MSLLNPLTINKTKGTTSEYLKDDIFELPKKIWRHDWLLQLCTQFKQLWNWSRKQIQAWTGYEPMTPAIPVQCSTNWAIKPAGRLSRCEFVLTVDGKECKLMHEKWYIWTVEKNSGFNGIRTHDLCDTGAVLYCWSCVSSSPSTGILRIHNVMTSSQLAW